jgi:hypothetical protein
MGAGLDWGDIAERVIELGAPMLGGALGGPMGAAAGHILADALGAAESTPATVRASIAADPAAAAAAAQAAESNWLAALADAGKTQVAEVGATQRAEMTSGDLLQRVWRPVYALELSVFECPLFVTLLAHELWIGHEAGINGLANLSALLMAYFGARFGVLGVYVSGRSKEKQASVTGELPTGLIGDLLKALVKKK